jgi:hypothetical protein
MKSITKSKGSRRSKKPLKPLYMFCIWLVKMMPGFRLGEFVGSMAADKLPDSNTSMTNRLESGIATIRTELWLAGKALIES